MVSVLLNICLQITEALIAFYFYESISHLSNNKLKRFAFVILGYAVMCALNLAFDYNVVINNLALLLFHFCFAHFLYRENISYSLFFSVMLTGLIGVSEIGVINIIASFTNNSSKAFVNDTFNYILIILFSKSILFFVLKIISGIISKFRSNEKTHFIYIIYPASLLVVIIDFILISYEYELSNNTKIILSVSSIIILIAVVVACIFQQQMSQREQELIELKAVKQKQEIENTYFELLEHQNEELQIFIHDIQKHFNNIYTLASDSQQTREYVSELSTDLSNSNKVGKTLNKLLDIIVSKYDYICGKNNIRFEKNIHSSDLSF